MATPLRNAEYPEKNQPQKRVTIQSMARKCQPLAAILKKGTLGREMWDVLQD